MMVEITLESTNISLYFKIHEDHPFDLLSRSYKLTFWEFVMMVNQFFQLDYLLNYSLAIHYSKFLFN